jgi:hypothetical protein
MIVSENAWIGTGGDRTDVLLIVGPRTLECIGNDLVVDRKVSGGALLALVFSINGNFEVISGESPTKYEKHKNDQHPEDPSHTQSSF